MNGDKRDDCSLIMKGSLCPFSLIPQICPCSKLSFPISLDSPSIPRSSSFFKVRSSLFLSPSDIPVVDNVKLPGSFKLVRNSTVESANRCFISWPRRG